MRKADEVGMLVQKWTRRIEHDLKLQSHIRVLIESIKHRENLIVHTDWWYVPVQIDTDNTNIHRFYEVLSEVEQHLEDSEDLDVLLVPSYPHEEQAA